MIRANGNVNLLHQLDSFASSLKYYVDMMMKNSANNNNTNETACAGNQADEETPEADQIPSSVATRCNVSPRKDTNEGEENTTEDEDEVNEEEQEEQEETDKGRRRSRRRRCTKVKDPDDCKETPSQSVSKKAPKRRKTQPETEKEEDLLDKLEVAHSCGLTRTVISNNFKSLGLSSPSIPVHMSVSMPPTGSSSDDIRPSHLTFQDGCIEFPYKERRNFFWRPKQGLYSLQLAEHLDPDQYPQEELPVFLSCGRGKTKPHLLHYVGHYQCIRFERKDHVFQGTPRQAILELKFAGYHKSICKKMAALASS